MNNEQRLALLFAFFAVQSTCLAQTVKLGGANSTKVDALIDERSKEIVRLYSDADSRAAIREMQIGLKGSERFKSTVIGCPIAPSPSPAGRLPKPIVMEQWRFAADTEVPSTVPKISADGTLTERQKALLKAYIAPAFKDPGDPRKFDTIETPRCPTPAPSPSGARDPGFGATDVKK